MIRAFNTLSDLEQAKLYTYLVGQKPDVFPNLDAMRKVYLGVPYNQGETQFSYWESGDVLGALALVTKEVITKGEAFIHAVFVPENAENVLAELLFHALDICPTEGLSSIKLGLPPSRADLAEVAKGQGFYEAYSMLEMCFRGPKRAVVTPNSFHYQGLTSENSFLFREIINAAFEHSQNGAILTEAEVAEFVADNAGSTRMGVCFCDEVPFGVYQVALDAPIGWIDTIGVHPDFQGRGLGASILSHCLGLLEGTQVKLIVVSSNTRAVRLYRQNGFEVESTIGAWFELPTASAVRREQ